MNSFILADVAALSAPVVFVALMSVLLLLGVRIFLGATGVALSRFASWLLDGSVVVLFLMFLVLVYVRFKIIG
jgi:hypothetical protein